MKSLKIGTKITFTRPQTEGIPVRKSWSPGDTGIITYVESFPSAFEVGTSYFYGIDGGKPVIYGGAIRESALAEVAE